MEASCVPLNDSLIKAKQSPKLANYASQRDLGQGGFGKAVLVRRLNDGALVVLKEIHLKRLARLVDEQLRDRPSKPSDVVEFARKEFDLMESVAHPNIVRVFEAFDDADYFYIAMEYCDSGTLRDAVVGRKGELFPESQIRNWSAQLALTLKFLHDRKVLHRDIKTDNVFLTCGGRVIKLGDFGIAKSLERPDQSAYTGVGTVAYTSPEHCDGRGYSHKSEVWSLGIVIYELTSLHLPVRSCYVIFSCL